MHEFNNINTLRAKTTSGISRISKFQQELSILNKKFSAMEGKIEGIEAKLKEKEETP